MATLLLEVAVRSALIATCTACILWALRVRTAAERHAAWAMVVIVMLLLPIWSVAGPKVPLAVLPTDAPSVDSGLGANPGLSSVAPRASATHHVPAPTADPAPKVSEFSRGMLVLIGAYVFGALALLVRLGVGTVQAHRLRRGAVVHAGRATSGRCATPITVGWLSPVLILPEGWARWTPAHLDAVVTHEHAHARRHDPLVQWLALLNRAIFWFHPLAWWLERRLGTLAEEACDAAVIRAGHSPQDYSDYLIDMARALRRQGRRLNVAGMAMPGSGLPERMRHIFEELPMKPLSRTRVICTLAFCTMSSIVFAAGMLVPRPSVVRDAPGAAGAQVNSDIVLREPSSTMPAPQRDGLAKRAGATPSEPADQSPASANAQSPSVKEPRLGDSPEPIRSGPPARVNAPDFSGKWSLVSATSSGPGRGGSGGSGGSAGSVGIVGEGERKVTAIWASGAPVNCGPECTILQDTKTLTISRLGTPNAVTIYDNGLVALNLDGSDSTVNHPSGTHYVVHANWNGDKLEVTYVTPWHLTVTQLLSVEDGKLKVVTDFGVGYPPVTATYVKG